ncbi:MAG: uroporphyrinogen decarboxylase family protein, partial [Arsenophonus sp. ET-DL12-MAG3]
VILFSDILTIPDAMGLGLYFSKKEGDGPMFKYPIRYLSQIKKLPIPDPEQELVYVMDAIRAIKKKLDNKVPLIGFSGSPWTLATYMIEGRSSNVFTSIKK